MPPTRRAWASRLQSRVIWIDRLAAAWSRLCLTLSTAVAWRGRSLWALPFVAVTAHLWVYRFLLGSFGGVFPLPY